MRKPLAFLKRHLLIEVSYRFSFVFQAVSVFLTTKGENSNNI